MIIPDRTASVNPFSQTFSKTLRISMIIAKEGHMPFTLSPQQRADLPPIQRLAAGGDFTPSEGVYLCRRLAAETRGGQDTLRVSYPPLDTPTSSLGRDSLRSRV